MKLRHATKEELKEHEDTLENIRQLANILGYTNTGKPNIYYSAFYEDPYNDVAAAGYQWNANIGRIDKPVSVTADSLKLVIAALLLYIHCEAKDYVRKGERLKSLLSDQGVLW